MTSVDGCCMRRLFPAWTASGHEGWIVAAIIADTY
jgi:hypothetical protein